MYDFKLFRLERQCIYAIQAPLHRVHGVIGWYYKTIVRYFCTKKRFFVRGDDLFYHF